MKTSGVSCETKFGLLVFLGHPSVHYPSEEDVVELSATSVRHLLLVFEGDGETNRRTISGMDTLQLGLVLWQPLRHTEHDPIKGLGRTEHLPVLLHQLVPLVLRVDRRGELDLVLPHVPLVGQLQPNVVGRKLDGGASLALPHDGGRVGLLAHLEHLQPAGHPRHPLFVVSIAQRRGRLSIVPSGSDLK